MNIYKFGSGVFDANQPVFVIAETVEAAIKKLNLDNPEWKVDRYPYIEKINHTSKVIL